MRNRRSKAGKELRGFVVSLAFIALVYWLLSSGVIESYLTQAFNDVINSSQP